MYATVEDINKLFRQLSMQEEERSNALIPIVEDLLRQEAKKVGKDLDQMIEDEEIYPNTIKSVIVDVISRVLMTSTNHEPMTQYSQSALGYSVSGTFLSPGGGIFIKKSELSRLGLKKQKIGTIELC
ncbi:MAG: phage Gp19/Gp15/Gp42 family protein [Floccifex sp.]